VDWKVFIISLLICEGVGLFGGLFTVASLGNWYKNLKKPKWNPPKWVFGPVWTLLYALMALALALVWGTTNTGTGKTTAIGIFAGQLAANAIWSFLFFKWKKVWLAFLDIALLWLLLLATFLVFYPISTPAAWLLTPYLAWVTFAGVLNFSIARLNGPARSLKN
jgi:tryptophan-rich sensory protein